MMARPTVLRIKRKRDEPPLNAILVQDKSKLRKTELHDAFSNISLSEESKHQQVFHYVSSASKKTDNTSVLDKVKNFNDNFKNFTKETFVSGSKRRTSAQKATQKARATKRLQQVETKRNRNAKHPQDPNIITKEDQSCLDKIMQVIDVAMVSDPKEQDDKETLYSSILDDYMQSKSGSANDEEKEDENSEYVYDYFCRVPASEIFSDPDFPEDQDSEKKSMKDYLDSLVDPSSLLGPNIGDVVITLPGDKGEDDEVYDNFGEESPIDEEDSNREHSDYPEEDEFTDDEEEVSSDGGSDDFELPRDFNRQDANLEAYDPNEDDGYFRDNDEYFS